MRFNLLSSFAAGILISTSICGVVYFSGKGEVSKASVKTVVKHSKIKVQPTEKEMKNMLVSAGYIVEKKDQYDKKIKAAKGSVQKDKGTSSNGNQSDKTVYRTVINVSQGMTSIDVGRMLVNAKIVPNAFKFSKDIEARGLENNLRPGAFEVDSKMSYDQVISTIFKK